MLETKFLGLRTCIYRVANLKEATTWYSKVFFTRPYFEEDFYVGFNIGGFELGLIGEGAQGNKKTDNVMTYWGVENVKEVYNKLLAEGARDHEKPHNVGGEIVVGAVKDPWGNILGMICNPGFKID